MMNLLMKKTVAGRAEQAELARMARQGDGCARERLIASVEPFIRKCALSWRRPGELEDLVQAGFEGALRAMERFDPGLGMTFLTYAMPWIRKMQGQHILDCEPISVPELRRAGYRLLGEREKEALEAACAASDVNECKAEGRYEGCEPMEEALKACAADEIRGAVRRLGNPRERAALRMYYGLGCDAAGGEDLARGLGISRSRILKVISDARRKLMDDPAVTGLR